MKQLFIRFFDNKSNGVPVNSYPICRATTRPEIQQGCIQAELAGMTDWMEKHPDGKVDFVWLY